MAGLITAAVVGVKLTPDASRFESEAKAEVEGATRDLDATIPVKADDKPARATVTKLRTDLLATWGKVSNLTLDMNDKTARAKVAALQAAVLRLDRITAKPDIDMADFTTAEAKALAINAELDKIDGRHVTAHVEVKERGSLFSRLFGGKGGGGGGLLGALGGLGGAAGGGVQGIGGAASSLGGSGQAALYGAAGLGAAALAPAAIPTALGAGLGGLGAFLAAGKQIGKIFSDSFTIIKRDVAPLRPLFVSVFSFLPGLAKSIGPALRDVFAESVPFLKTFLGLLGPIAKILLPAFSRVLREMTPFLPQISRGILAVVGGLAGMLNALGPRGIRDSVTIFVGLCKLAGVALTVLGKVINATAVFFVWLANKIKQRVADWRQTFDDFRHRTAVIFDGLRHDIAHVWDIIYNNTIGTVIRFVSAVHTRVADFRHTVAGVFDGIRHDVASAWEATWNTVKNTAVDAYHWVYDHVWTPWKNLLTKTLPGWFHDAVSAVGTAWGKVEGAVKVPVNWVITHVINGLIGAFDWVTSHIGLGKPIPKVPTLAAGGLLAGYGGGDRHPALLEAGETVVSKESSRLPFMLAAFRAAQVPGYAGGGQVPPAESRFGTSTQPKPGSAPGIFGQIDAIARLTAAAATGNTVALSNAISALFPHGVGGAAGELAKVLTTIPAKLLSDGVHWIISHFKSAVGFGGGGAGVPAGGGVQRWAGLVRTVLAMLGQPAGDLGVVLSQMTTESGGNPRAINLTDSNAAAGDPSRGLMQTIMSTFLAYAGRFASRGIYDPLANIYAGVNYAIHRYGAGWTSVLGHGHGYGKGGRVRAFANGGVIPEPVAGIGMRTGARYSFAERGPEPVGGPLLHIEHLHVEDRTQVELLAQRVAFLIGAPGVATAGFGG